MVPVAGAGIARGLVRPLCQNRAPFAREPPAGLAVESGASYNAFTMRRRFHLFLLLITALWLPLQAVAAIAMPFCRHAAEQALQQGVAADGDHCPGHAGAEAPPADNGGSASSDQDCDGCELCHLASAGYLLPATGTAGRLPPARDFAAHPVLASPSFIPEPPQHPPRRLS